MRPNKEGTPITLIRPLGSALCAAALLGTECFAVVVNKGPLGLRFATPLAFDYAPSAITETLPSGQSRLHAWLGIEPLPYEHRINVGGGPLLGITGVWAADTYFDGGNTWQTSAPIAGADEPAVYQTERWGDFSYHVPVPFGSHRVTLKFAEFMLTQPGQRIFDVAVSWGKPSGWSGVDIASLAGPFRALDRWSDVCCTTAIDVTFQRVIDWPKLDGITVQRLGMDTIFYTQDWQAPGLAVICPSEGGSNDYQDTDFPLCTLDHSGGPDRFMVNDPSVIRTDRGFLNYYTAPLFGDGAGTCAQIYLAESQDGIHWTKWPSGASPQPVVPYPFCVGNDPYEYGIGEASAVFRDDTYYLYYTHAGRDATGRPISTTFRTSSDGIHFGPAQAIEQTDSTNGNHHGGDFKWIPEFGLWFSVSPRLTNTLENDAVLWNISRDGVHWLPEWFRTQERTIGPFPDNAPFLKAPALVGDGSGWILSTAGVPSTSVLITGGSSANWGGSWDIWGVDLQMASERAYGWLDVITEKNVLWGWAYDPDTGTNDAAANGGASAPLGHHTAVKVRATRVKTGEVLESQWVPAAECRADLPVAGAAPDCYHGFVIDLNEWLPSGRWEIQVEAGEFPIGGGATLLPGTLAANIP